MVVKPTLSAYERKILKAFAETYMPRGGAIELGAEDISYLPFFDDFLRAVDPIIRIGFRYLIHQWNWLPILYLRSAKRFTSMNQQQRTYFMEKLSEDHNFFRRVNILVFKFLLSMKLYSDPRVEKAIGYKPHCPGIANPTPDSMREVS